jgi:hypothetical protein
MKTSAISRHAPALRRIAGADFFARTPVTATAFSTECSFRHHCPGATGPARRRIHPVMGQRRNVMNTLLTSATRGVATAGFLLALAVAFSSPALAQKQYDPDDPECPLSVVCKKPQTRALNKKDGETMAAPKTVAKADKSKEAAAKPQTRALKKKPKKEACADENTCK